MIERMHLMIIQRIQLDGSLTEAANSLHLTQSALSHAIKKLELSLGVDLWEKRGRTIHFTEAGVNLLEIANRVLPQFQHADDTMRRYAAGEKGELRIGMECSPCYQWLLKAVSPYLQQWPEIDIDVKQSFQFGGVDALMNYEIDILVTPDPLQNDGISYIPVFDYEQVLVVSKDHPLAHLKTVEAKQLKNETLFTYPVDLQRLDIYQEFFTPADCAPSKRKTIEATEIMLQLVESNRGVAALPLWLINEYRSRMRIKSIKLGKKGIQKKIFLGTRESNQQRGYVQEFVNLAKKIDI